MLRAVKYSRLHGPVDRRHFVTAVTAGFATQLALVPENAAAQTPRASSTSSTRPLPPDSGLFKGFEAKWVRTNGADIFLRHGGEGPPLLLLHGNPQTHACFHKIAETLAKRFHVVVADLRGYGDSVGPTDGGKDHENYSFRVMAQDQVDVMAALGHDRFFVAGQDRGARAAYRMALDHKERVRKVALLDILPTRYVWANTSRDWALNSWHWVFMAQPDDMFERMIAAIPAREFVLRHLGRSGKPEFFDGRAVAEYVRCFTPKTIHGSCEDYRAAAGIDLTHDEVDHKAGRKIAAPVLALWGSRSHTGRFYGGDLLSIWRAEADDVSGGDLDSGHYLVEEAPLAVLAAFNRFFV
jgi:haloacetate dehalogenase